MATKSERAQSEAVREDAAKKRAAKERAKPKKAPVHREKTRTSAKAVYALETTAPGKRPSRESTRSSANRAKGDTAFNLTDQMKKGAPANRARKSRTKAVKVRGGGSPPKSRTSS